MIKIVASLQNQITKLHNNFFIVIILIIHKKHETLKFI